MVPVSASVICTQWVNVVNDAYLGFNHKSSYCEQQIATEMMSGILHNIYHIVIVVLFKP